MSENSEQLVLLMERLNQRINARLDHVENRVVIQASKISAQPYVAETDVLVTSEDPPERDFEMVEREVDKYVDEDADSAYPVNILPETLPAMITVRPTPEQNNNYQLLKEQLNDPFIISNLSLSELMNRPEFLSLPAPMRDSIVSRAIEKFNGGEVEKDVFLNGLRRE